MIRTIETAKKTALQNVTAEMASVGILSILEPLLGVINACLPLLRPVFSRIREMLGIERAPTTKSQNSQSPYLQSIGSRRIRTKISDPFPLDTIMTMNNQSDEDYRKRSAGDGESVKQLIHSGGHPDGGDQLRPQTQVKQDWEISYKQV